MNKTSFGLWRTEDPKYSHYMNDGHGRDTFISFSNGGLMKNYPSFNPQTGVHIPEFRHSH